jgi:putative tryptophan/tyrosine transport system substrate-binding protein
LRRREFITLLGGAAAGWPLVVRAQQPVRRIAVLTSNAEGDPANQARAMALEQGLAKLGWTIGRNVRINYRWGAVDLERMQAHAAELLALAPDVFLANTGRGAATLQQLTRTVPIFFIGATDPVEQGLVQSLAHPGGNMTGFTAEEATVGGKSLGLLKEVAPRVRRVTYMFNPDRPGGNMYSASALAAAPKLAVELVITPVRGPSEIEAAITGRGREPGMGLLLPRDGFTFPYRKLIIDLAARYRLPAIYGHHEYVDDGGLAFYGVDMVDLYRQAATYVDRIFRGEKPGDLPVQQPNKYEIVINLRTAKALGLTIPSGVLAIADEVIE